MRTSLVAALAVVTALGGAPRVAKAGDGPPPDAIDDALALAGLSRKDLGWEARGWWDRYPQDVPWKMRHVDALFAEPLATVPWLRSMGAQVKDLLSPAGLAKREPERGGALFRLVHDLGVHRRTGASRAYSPNLDSTPTPLSRAIVAAIHDAKRATRLVTFGKEANWPRVEEDLATAVAPLPKDVSEALGRLVVDLTDAERWVDLAWRRVPLETRVAIEKRLGEVGIEETDALDYAPEFDDAARAWDEQSLWYAGLKVVEALDVAREALAKPVAEAKETLAKFRLDIRTPYGRVLVLGTGDDDVDVGTEGAWLVVDLGGNDRIRGGVGASSATLPVAACLDLSGDDVYEGGDRAQGAGCVGVGVLLDVQGKDRYSMTGTLGQGAGLFGLGVLADLAGDDTYVCPYSGQGCGFFGIGMCLDAAGDDSYTLDSDGQGFGGVAGVGVLADRSGDDRYEAVVDPAVTKRPSYHTENKVTVSNAQGCGMGRRGDGADGHSWAGGIGCLLDVEGNDAYTAANWCQGCGYWFGTGLLWDGAGDDRFLANGWASGSGAHFSVGCLVDESGDDLHRVAQNWGLGYGHDFTVGICVDLAGNDVYEAGEAGIGWSINRSVAILVDGGGDDVYRYAKPALIPGTAVFDARFLDRSGASLYWTESTSVGLFVDVGGKDAYPAGRTNDSAWTDAVGSDNRRARNHGIFVDRASGTVDFDRPHGGKR